MDYIKGAAALDYYLLLSAEFRKCPTDDIIERRLDAFKVFADMIKDEAEQDGISNLGLPGDLSRDEALTVIAEEMGELANWARAVQVKVNNLGVQE